MLGTKLAQEAPGDMPRVSAPVSEVDVVIDPALPASGVPDGAAT